MIHELLDQYWFRPREGRTRIGLTESFIEGAAADWLKLELSGPGTRIEEGASFGFLTTEAASHDLRAPCDLLIVAINSLAAQDPNRVRLSPRGEGWLLEVEELSSSALA